MILVPEGREIIVHGQPRRVMVPPMSERIGRYQRIVPHCGCGSRLCGLLTGPYCTNTPR